MAGRIGGLIKRFFGGEEKKKILRGGIADRVKNSTHKQFWKEQSKKRKKKKGKTLPTEPPKKNVSKVPLWKKFGEVREGIKKAGNIK